MVLGMGSRCRGEWGQLDMGLIGGPRKTFGMLGSLKRMGTGRRVLLGMLGTLCHIGCGIGQLGMGCRCFGMRCSLQGKGCIEMLLFVG